MFTKHKLNVHDKDKMAKRLHNYLLKDVMV